MTTPPGLCASERLQITALARRSTRAVQAARVQLGKELYNHTWWLIELMDRTQEQVDDTIASTHASAYHWSTGAGTLANAVRSQFRIARVCAITV
ncbi:MAG: hypothetical protein HYX55_02155 [Chloroflexi bacterium]|nr:hypothetical protein [Chloroflexota bacterium]